MTITTFRKPIRFLLAFVCLLSLNPTIAQSIDKPILLKGVGNVPLPSQPDFLCTTVSINKHPEIILTGRAEPSQPYELIALSSSRLGKGKLLVFGTPAYFRKPLVQHPEVQKLLTNALNWGSRARRKRVQVWGGDEALTTFLTQKARAKLTGSATVLDPSADVLLLSKDLTDTIQIAQVEQFVRRGGTLLYGSPLPDLQRATPQVAVEMGFNKLLWKAGLLQLVYPSMIYAHQGFLSAGAVPDYLGMDNILRSISTNTGPTADQFNEHGVFSYTLDMAVSINPANSPIISRLKQAARYHADSLLVPTTEKPVKQGKGHDYLTYQVQHRLLNKELREHPDPTYIAPAAASFPGAVPATAARITTELVVPVRVGSNGLLEPGPGYRRPHGTGLYVPPGEKVGIYLTDSNARRLEAQIGVHSDDLTEQPQLTREAFDLTRNFELKQGRNEIYSPYGGLLLLNIPDTTSLEEVRLRVEGAVQAPRFERGKTNLGEWQRTIRKYPGPWAELVSDNISLTVPSARIRMLDNPEKLLAFWDEVMNTDAKLAALTIPRRHPERIIVDRQVAAGYMFATDRKIVVPDDNGCGEMLDVNFMQKNGSWGHFHELGHRHQFWGLDFDGLSEVSVNLYTMYVFDKLLHKGLYNHPQVKSRQMVAEKASHYLANSPSFEKWKADPFLALAMYIQLIDAFGWQSIERVYQQYRKLPKSQYPTTEAAKRDYWFTTICTATGRNLAPFFAQWQVPISQEAQRTAVNYPTWLPSEMRAK